MKRYMGAILLAFVSQACGAASGRGIDATVDQKVDEVVSIFENSTPELQYSYVEALGDGRGYTAGRAGFTTGTGDLVLVIERFSKLEPSNKAWSAMLPRLEAVAKSGSGSTTGLKTLPALWKKSSDDALFRKAQDDVSDELYKSPARLICKKLGLKTPLGLLVIYDAIIQHGDGSDYDSLGGMISRTHSDGTELDFITKFLAVRRDDLQNPADPATKKEWSQSVDRVDALKRLVDDGKWNLESPLRLQVWGDTYAL